MNNPWFRLYSETVDNEKLRLLAFEDRWHYIAILCCKCDGVLDDGTALLRRKVAVKLGVDLPTLEEVARRLAEVELINFKTLQPLAWDRRQFVSDVSTERTRKFREKRKRSRNVPGTLENSDGNGPDTEQNRTETEHTKPAPKSGVVTKPDGVPDQVWSDFLKIRKAKRSPLTATALAGIGREAKKAGMSLADALSECCARGWQGFESSWVVDRSPPANRPSLGNVL